MFLRDFAACRLRHPHISVGGEALRCICWTFPTASMNGTYFPTIHGRSVATFGRAEPLVANPGSRTCRPLPAGRVRQLPGSQIGSPELCHYRSTWILDSVTYRSFRPISQTNRDLLYCEKIAPKTRLRPEFNALPDLGFLAQMNSDSMHTINRRNFSSRNTRERYFYFRACAPDFQVISAVNHLISNTEKSPLL
jgi:hypothetical protein